MLAKHAKKIVENDFIADLKNNKILNSHSCTVLGLLLFGLLARKEEKS